MSALAQRRAAIRAALLAGVGQSDRAVSAEVNCGRDLVGRVRREMLAAGELQAGPRVGLDGKTYQLPARRTGPRDRVEVLQARVAKLTADLTHPQFVAIFRTADPDRRRRLASALGVAGRVSSFLNDQP